MKKNKEHYRKQYMEMRRRQRADVLLLLAAAVIYYGILFILIVLTLADRIPLYQGGGPSPWLFLLQGYYYAAPVMLAVVYGFIFRPFWRRFRNLLAVILFVHTAASFAMVIWHQQYIAKQDERLYDTRLASWSVKEATHRFLDRNQDGVIDAVQFTGQLNVKNLPPGKYYLRAGVSPSGQRGPEKDFGEVPFTVSRGKILLAYSFGLDLGRFERSFSGRNLDLVLRLQRLFVPDAEGRRVLVICRWTPFFRTCSWGGKDPDIQGRFITVGVGEKVDSFHVYP